MFRYAAFAVALIVAPSCIGDLAQGDGESSGGDEQGLSSAAGCRDAAVASTFTSGRGVAKSGASYGTSACPNSYFVQINAAPLDQQPTVAWGGALPTTKADCEGAKVNAFVWRIESSGSKTFLGSAERKGLWGPDLKGVNRCIPPYLRLGADIDGMVLDGTKTYKVGMSAFRGNSFFKVGLDTVTVKRRLDDTLFSLPTTTVRRTPVTDAFFAVKGSNATATAVFCRQLKIEKQLHEFAKAGYLRVGVTDANVTDIVNGLNTAITAICTTGGTKANFDAGTAQYIAGINAARNSLASIYSLGQQTGYHAADTLVGITTRALGLLSTNCAVTGTDLMNYFADGTVPSGATTENLLFGTCKNRGGTPAEVASALGFGALFPGQSRATARDKYNQCMKDSAGAALCNDPRAQDAPDAGDPVTSDEGVGGSGSEACWDSERNAPCSASQQSTWDEEQNSKAEAIQSAVNTNLTGGNPSAAPAVDPSTLAHSVNRLELAAIGAAILATLDYAQKVASYVEAVQKAEAAGIALAASDVLTGVVIVATPIILLTGACAIDADCVRLTGEQMGKHPIFPGAGTFYCNPDYSTGGGWMETDGPPGVAHQLTSTDRFNHCLCELMDDTYAGVQGASGFAPLGCPTAAEKRREDCLKNPQDERDGTRFACLRELSPPMDADARAAKICSQVTCPANKVKMTTEAGNCQCVTTPVDTGVGLPCTAGSTMRCDGDVVDASHCTCTPTAFAPPVGDNPNCATSTDATAWPGSIDSWLMRSPRDVVVHQRTTASRFALVKPNLPIVTPRIFRNSLAAVPAPGGTAAKLRVKAMLEALPSSGNVDLQIYVTSFDTPNGTQRLVHDFMGQVRLTGSGNGSLNLQAGVPTDVDIALDQNLINRAFSGKSFRIEYTTVAPSGYVRRIAIGPQSFVGNTTTIPSNQRAPLCPPNPTPDDPIRLITGANPSRVLDGPTFNLSAGAPAAVLPRSVRYQPAQLF